MVGLRYFAPLLAVFSIGCVAFQDCEYRAFQHGRSHTAWWFGCDKPCSSNPWSHYSKGWRRGYTDVLLGGDGACPPVPPACYWSPKFQCEYGEIAIQDWFQGYADGAQAGLNSCRGRYHPVPFSNSYPNCFPGCLSSDMSPYDFGKTTLGLKTTRHPNGNSETPAAFPTPDSMDRDDVEDYDSQEPINGAWNKDSDIPPSPDEISKANDTSSRSNIQISFSTMQQKLKNSFPVQLGRNP